MQEEQYKMRKRERPKAESVREMKKQTRDMEMLIKCLNRRNTVRKKMEVSNDAEET